MPILNSIYRGKRLFVSEFYCPYCFAMNPYKLKPVSKAFAVHRIPLVAENPASHAIECQVCCKAFDPEVLNRHVQSLYKLAGAAKYQLENGISPGYLKLQLVSDGMKESLAEQLISLAQP